MLRKSFWIILLAIILFWGRKETIAFFCDTELTLEQVRFENASDTLTVPPDSVLQEPLILTITAHIVRKGNGFGGIREDIVLTEIDRLNQAFAGTNISFEVCTFNYINNDKLYNLVKYDEGRLLAYDIKNTINIYFVNQIKSAKEGNICGYTYYPTNNLDHVFMAKNCVAGGTTLIHELGHFFGLYHTHESQFGVELVSGANCDKAGDLICDTPADPGLRATLISETCEFTGFITDIFNTAYEPPTNNYMSYSRQSCRNMFTEEQLFKMRLNYHYFKGHIKKLNTAFEVSDSVIVLGDTLTLTASGGMEYWWSTGDTTAQIKVTPDSSSVYSVNIVTENECNVFKKYAVEVISSNFITAPETVCENESANIVFDYTKEHLIYMLTDEVGDVVYSAMGNGDTLDITTRPLKNTEHFAVSILDPETEQYWQLKEPLTIEVIPLLGDVVLNLEVPEQEEVCRSSIMPIRIAASDTLTTYQLMANAQPIGEPRFGNGATLTLFTAPIDSSTTYHLRLANSCYSSINYNIVSFNVAAYPTPDEVEYTLSAGEVEKGNPVTITVGNSLPELSYQLMLNNRLLGNPRDGNNSDLHFKTPALAEDAQFCLIVSNNAGCRAATEFPISISVVDYIPDLSFNALPDNIISYSVPERSRVYVNLFYLDGRHAATLLDESTERGRYEYVIDPIELGIPAGNYMLRARVNGELVLNKITSVFRY